MRKILATLVSAAALVACGGSSDSGTTKTNGNDPFPGAGQISIGGSVQGDIASASDRDYYRFTVPANGATVRFQTFDETGTGCDTVNWDCDPWIEVYNSAGAFVAGDDDTGVAGQPGYSWCEDLSIPLQGGTHYVMVSGYQPFPVTYTLKLSTP